MIIKWIQEQIDRLCKAEELEKLKQENKKSSERILQLEENVSRLERIQKYYMPGEIHHKTVNAMFLPTKNSDEFIFVHGGWTYIYISGREYKFTGLELNNPSFSRGLANNLINVTDINENGEYEYYVLDIESLKYLSGSTNENSVCEVK